MMRSYLIFYLTFLLIFISSCSVQKQNVKEINFFNYNRISLNIFDFKIAMNNQKYNLSNSLGFETTFLLSEISNWGNRKFNVLGKKNSLVLTIEDMALKVQKVKKNSGLKKVFFSEDEKEYNLKLIISLNFFDKKRTLEKLTINGNISFIINDTQSISDKKKILMHSYNKLLEKIDKTLNKEIKKKIFSNFIFPQ